MANNIHKSIPNNGSSSSTVAIQVEWELPPLGWVKLNIDGVVQRLEGWASIGVCLETQGETGYLVLVDAWHMMVELLNAREEDGSQLSLVRRIRDTCSKEWTVRIQLVYTEANTVADALAKSCPVEEVTWHIYAVNGLSQDQTLLVHCKSKDDDLGIHNLTVGSEFTWKFRPRFFGGTLFWCYMTYDNLHASFKAFWDNQALYNLCDWGTCFWIAKDDGIYIRNIPKNRDDYYYNREQGRL
ncbi:hypothetical protein Godav_025967 [Gossypium davidsonii]|uniref:S-protein homolog n=1 Tax=Gossypium davidsonii TaxID=34287 RepID=A0A7J8TC23_GOSDV|nr:hypothetical protein [Gossypium davidsonii]